MMLNACSSCCHSWAILRAWEGGVANSGLVVSSFFMIALIFLKSALMKLGSQSTRVWVDWAILLTHVWVCFVSMDVTFFFVGLTFWTRFDFDWVWLWKSVVLCLLWLVVVSPGTALFPSWWLWNFLQRGSWLRKLSSILFTGAWNWTGCESIQYIISCGQ